MAMKLKIAPVLLIFIVSGCVPAQTKKAANRWVGQPMDVAVRAFGDPLKSERQGEDSVVKIWRFERYEDYMVPAGNYLAIGPGGRPTLYPLQDIKRTRFACELALTAEGGRIVASNLRALAGTGHARSGACVGHGW